MIKKINFLIPIFYLGYNIYSHSCYFIKVEFFLISLSTFKNTYMRKTKGKNKIGATIY
jgi:hypothetical protein